MAVIFSSRQAEMSRDRRAVRLQSVIRNLTDEVPQPRYPHKRHCEPGSPQ